MRSLFIISLVMGIVHGLHKRPKVYLNCEPMQRFEYIGGIDMTHRHQHCIDFVDTSRATNDLVNEVLEEFPTADGILLDTKDSDIVYADIVEFK